MSASISDLITLISLSFSETSWVICDEQQFKISRPVDKACTNKCLALAQRCTRLSSSPMETDLFLINGACILVHLLLGL